LGLSVVSHSGRDDGRKKALIAKESSMTAKKMTMGLIVGNRGFFPDHLAKSGREEMLRVL